MIVKEKDMGSIIKDFKDKGKKVVTTNGSFDILHAAHVAILEKAKSLGDILVVLVNSDNSVKKNKGPKRPINDEKDRAYLLDSLVCVDYVCIFDSVEVVDVLEKLKPSVHVKGGTFIPERVKKEQEIMESVGGVWKNIPEIDGYSSSNIISKVLDVYKDETFK
ncbi:MAG: adenylyltransferase/cytidyltransferase family protein [Nanobdellota archaeon]